MSNVDMLTPEQGQRALAVAYAARVPINLVGVPGVGKTMAVESFAARMKKVNPKFGYWPLILSQKGAEDFGIPGPNGNRLKYLFPPDLPIGVDDAEGLMFMDEYDRCVDESVKNSAMQFCLGGNFHGTRLSKNVFVVMAMNGTSDILTGELSEAARTRMIHIYIGTKAPGYWESWKDWAIESGVDPAVAGFVPSRTDLFDKDEEFEELARYNPRTAGWLLNRIWTALKSCQFKTDDIARPLLAGAVGRAAAIQFMAYAAVADSMPSVDDIIRKPDTTALPDKIGAFYALGVALAQKLSDRPAAVKAAAKYIGRWPKEQAMGAFVTIGKRCPAMIATAEYAALANGVQ